MKSPVPDTTPSDCEEGSDCTPLLQHAPRAETGEQLLDRGSSGGRWSQDGGVQRCLGHRGLRTRSPLTAPRSPPSSGAQKPLWGPGRGWGCEAKPGRAEAPGPRQVRPRGLGRCSRRTYGGA